MSTGIPAKDLSLFCDSPVTLEYEGKHPKDWFLQQQPKDFKQVASIHGGGTNSFFFGDNADVLRYLLSQGFAKKVRLVYIDPPFATASVFLGRNQRQAYSDALCGSPFIEFLRERLVLLRELLADDGSIYLHLDNKMTFQMKIIMDEIFGSQNFRSFITRKKCSTKNYTKRTYGNVSDYIMFYSKSDAFVWNRPFEPWNLERMLEEYPYTEQKTGRRYKKVPLHAPGTRNGDTGKPWRGKMPPPGKHWQYTPQKLDELDAAGEIYWSPTGNPRRMVFCEPDKGIPIQDIWLNYRDSINQAQKTTGYPTEKNLDMLKLIVTASSNPGDLVLDCFAGGGSTLEAAFCLQRNWIGADSSPESLNAIIKRFTEGLDRYGDYVSTTPSATRQLTLELVPPCAFDVFCSPDQTTEIQTIITSLGATSP